MVVQSGTFPQNLHLNYTAVVQNLRSIEKATSGIKLLPGEKCADSYLSVTPIGKNAIMEEELRRLSVRDKNLFGAAGGASLSRTEASGTCHCINHEPWGKSQLTSACFGIISLSVPLH